MKAFVELHISHDLVNTFNFSFTIELNMLLVDTDGIVLSQTARPPAPDSKHIFILTTIYVY